MHNFYRIFNVGRTIVITLLCITSIAIFEVIGFGFQPSLNLDCPFCGCYFEKYFYLMSELKLLQLSYG